METGEGPGPDHLTSHHARLLADPTQFHIFHALRVIEAEFADNPRMGESKRPREDAYRLEQEAELAFPTSTIAALVPPQDGRPGRLVNRFFGLFGPMGPMPLHLTEYVRDRVRNRRDPTMLAFANMLTHRLFTLLYRAWAVAQPTASYDRALRGERGNAPPDPFERKVAALTGHMADGFRDRDHMPDLAKRFFSGHLANGTRHPEGLVSMLSLFVRAPVSIDEFVGEWLDLEPEDRWRLGARVGLGQGTGVGSRVFTHGAKFRLRIGPLSLAEFRRLLPGGPSLDRLEDIVRNYVGDTFDWDINLILHEAEVPVTTLGEGTALGHTSWIGQRRADSHADDLYLVPKSLARRRAAAGA